MIARAPGKVVLSGAYAVLEGAPAIVSAVDRYVTADSSRAAGYRTPEVEAAIGARPAPWFDASELREGGEKLGLGSSAAILVASLAAIALEAHGPLDHEALSDIVLEAALRAHAEAQGGGSGIDVAASCRGGTLVARRTDTLELREVDLPGGLHLEVWAAGKPASTAELLSRVRALDAARYRALIAPQQLASERAVQALDAGDAAAFVSALAAQCNALGRLGDAAGAPIVTSEVQKLAELAARERAAVLPSGAGGGDVALFAGVAAPSPELSALARELGQRRLDLSLGAQGVHAVSG